MGKMNNLRLHFPSHLIYKKKIRGNNWKWHFRVAPPSPGRLRRYKFLHYAYTFKISRYAPENQTVKLFKLYKAKKYDSKGAS